MRFGLGLLKDLAKKLLRGGERQKPAGPTPQQRLDKQLHEMRQSTRRGQAEHEEMVRQRRAELSALEAQRQRLAQRRAVREAAFAPPPPPNDQPGRISQPIWRNTGRDIDRRPPGSPHTRGQDTGEQRQSFREGMIPVQSSNVAALRWEWTKDNLGTLLVKFREKRTRRRTYPASLYKYFDVPEDVYDDFFAAASKGAFVWDYLRDRYAYERIA